LAALAQQPAAASTAEGLWFAAVAGSARWVSAAPEAGSGSEWQNLHYSCPYHHHLTTVPQQNHFIYFRQQGYILHFFKHAAPSPFYFPQNAMYFTILSFFFGSNNIYVLHKGCTLRLPPHTFTPMFQVGERLITAFLISILGFLISPLHTMPDILCSLCLKNGLTEWKFNLPFSV
jgi:hypothetical protein